MLSDSVQGNLSLTAQGSFRRCESGKSGLAPY